MIEQWIPLGVAAVLAALVLLVAAFVAAGRLGEMPEAVTDTFLPEVPPVIGPDDLAEARFGTCLRGYAPDQVDRLLARAQECWAADRAARTGDAPATATPPVDTPAARTEDVTAARPGDVAAES